MPDFIFVPVESLATVAKVTAADAQAALAKADLGPLPQKVTAVQVIGTYWVLADSDAQVVRKTGQ